MVYQVLISIAAHIRRSLVGLATGLCIAFSALTFMLVYIIEDQIFINQLNVERIEFEESLDSSNKPWQPKNRYMTLFFDSENLPPEFKKIIGRKPRVYEAFDEKNAAFLLYGITPNTQEKYYILYDVSKLLAVRNSRSFLFMTIVVLSSLIIIAAILIAIRLARMTLSPLREITDQLKDNKNYELPEKFSKKFYKDEIGVLTRELDNALTQATAAANREFEFNRGVSHELRSPIQAAQGATELLIKINLNKKNINVLQRLQRSVIEMQQIVETFLWLASDKSTTAIEESNLSIIEEILKNHRMKYSNHLVSVEIDTKINAQSSFRLPKDVLALLLNNLLRNAIGHSSSKNTQCFIRNQEIEIRNLGSSQITSSNNGYGIGLTIVKSVCDRFDWTIEFSQNENHYISAVLRDPIKSPER